MKQRDYPSELVAGIVKAIKEADAKVRPVQAQAGVAQQQGLSFNRRFHMKDGTVRFNPGLLNPDIVRAAGPIDPGVGMVFFREASGKGALAGLVNFALHLDTTGGTLYAADYPYFMEQNLREKFGKDFTLLFGTGTCGDINHFDVTTKDRLKPESHRRDPGRHRGRGAAEGHRQAESRGQAGGGRSAHAEVHGRRDRAGEEGHGQDRHLGAVLPRSGQGVQDHGRPDPQRLDDTVGGAGVPSQR